MSLDFFVKSSELLEKLANSVYDRDPKNPTPLFFNVMDIHLVEQWLKEFINEAQECI